MTSYSKSVLTAIVSLALSSAASSQTELLSQNRFVPHSSTVSANEGQRVGIFVHEKLKASVADAISAGESMDGRVVLFVHGVSVSSVPAFDLPYKDYSWMNFLAENGYDTFSMDHQGYGFSPQPHMDNPCNLSEDARATLSAANELQNCMSSYNSQLTSSQTDWDEIDSVVDYIRELRGVDTVSIIGWSLGGIRSGGYAARHPEKLNKLVLFAPVYQSSGASTPPENFPLAGAPMRLQSHDALINDRWMSNVDCPDQVEPGIADAVWETIMGFDRYGRSWAPPLGVMRVRTGSTWGWNKEFSAKITTPTLIMVGEQDGLLAGGKTLYNDLNGTSNKVLVTMNCATHFALWEASQYKFMQQASLEWLSSAQYRTQNSGVFRVDFGGKTINP